MRGEQPSAASAVYFIPLIHCRTSTGGQTPLPFDTEFVSNLCDVNRGHDSQFARTVRKTCTQKYRTAYADFQPPRRPQRIAPTSQSVALMLTQKPLSLAARQRDVLRVLFYCSVSRPRALEEPFQKASRSLESKNSKYRLLHAICWASCETCGRKGCLALTAS